LQQATSAIRGGSTPLEANRAGSISALAKKGRSNERNQFFTWADDRAVHDPVGPVEVQAESADDGFSITEDVPILRIDHIPGESSLPGVWRSQRFKTVVKGRTQNYEEHQISGETETQRR
jgi:hypothetical protein